MSKVLATLGFLVVGSGASLTSAYALGAFDPDYVLPLKNITNEDDIKEELKQEGCVQSMFPGIGSLATNSTLGTDDLSNNFFSSDKTKKSCLVVNWDKWSSNNKFQGNFRFLWAMGNDTKGFILFASADTTADSKMKFKGVAYTVKYEGQTWVVDKKKADSLTNGHEVDKDNFSGVGEGLEDTAIGKKYWGLVEDTGDFSKLEALDDAKRTTNSENKFRK